jgi:hypothetical protein
MTFDASVEPGMTGQKSAKHGNACDCRVPVAHLLVALRASTD